MINRERYRLFRKWRKRRNTIMPCQDCVPLHDLGVRHCSCIFCQPDKLEPNKYRRQREYRQWRREVELVTL